MKQTAILAMLLGLMGGARAEEKTNVMVKRAAPNLYVEDVAPCVKFWERLGFTKTMEVPAGAKLAFAQMKRGDLEVMYGSYASLDKEAPAMRKALLNSTAFLFVEVANLDAAIEATKGAAIVAQVHKTFYGSTEITVKDPGGNIITLAQFGAQPGKEK